MIDFVEVEKAVRELKRQLADGKIDQESFEARLVEMIDVAEDGYYWMFGHKSERWFRHNGEAWLPDTPGEIFLSALGEDLDALGVNTPTPPAEPSHVSKQPSIKPAWLIASLIILGIIAGIIYNATSLVY